MLLNCTIQYIAGFYRTVLYHAVLICHTLYTDMVLYFILFYITYRTALKFSPLTDILCVIYLIVYAGWHYLVLCCAVLSCTCPTLSVDVLCGTVLHEIVLKYYIVYFTVVYYPKLHTQHCTSIYLIMS